MSYHLRLARNIAGPHTETISQEEPFPAFAVGQSIFVGNGSRTIEQVAHARTETGPMQIVAVSAPAGAPSLVADDEVLPWPWVDELDG